MLLNQNRIELVVRSGFYEEATLNSGSAKVLPGALLELREDVYGNNLCNPVTDNITGFETAIVLENALVGKAIHAVQYDNEVILVRRPVSGDTYLIRAVPGSYKYGDPLYASQTANGIYVSKTGDGKFIGWAAESYDITEDMMDAIDTSTRDLPSDKHVNGILVNLLRVRIGSAKKLYSGGGDDPTPTTISYTVTANGSDSAATDTITITLASAPATDLVKSEINCSLATGNLTKVSPTVYTLAVTTPISGTATLSIAHTGIETGNKSFTSYAAPSSTVVGYWGVCYPDVVGRTVPTTDAIKAIAKQEITGSPRTMECAFALNEAEWRAAGGTGDFATEAAGRAFFITTNWGNAQAITSNNFDVHEAFEPYHVTLHGVSYDGYITTGSPVVFDGTPYQFVF